MKITTETKCLECGEKLEMKEGYDKGWSVPLKCPECNKRYIGRK